MDCKGLVQQQVSEKSRSEKLNGKNMEKVLERIDLKFSQNNTSGTQRPPAKKTVILEHTNGKKATFLYNNT